MALALAAAAVAHGATWTGTSSNRTANWSSTGTPGWAGAVPNGTDAAATVAVSGITAIHVNGAYTVGSLDCTGTGTYTFDGTGSLTFKSATTATLSLNRANPLKFEVGVALGSDLDTQISGGGGAIFYANVDLAGHTLHQTSAGRGVLEFAGSVNDSTGNGEVKLSSGGLLLRGPTNSFRKLTLDGGLLIAANDASFGTGDSTVTWNGGCIAGYGSSVVTRALTLSGDGMISGGTIDRPSASVPDATFNGPIGEASPGRSLTIAALGGKTGTPGLEPTNARITLGATNTYSGGTTFFGYRAYYGAAGNQMLGTLQLAGTNALGSGALTLPTPGVVRLAADQQIAGIDGSATPDGTPLQEWANKTVTVNNSTNTLTLTGHHLVANQVVQFNAVGTIATGVVPDNLFYVIPVTANTFKLALSPDGPALDLLSVSQATLSTGVAWINGSTGSPRTLTLNLPAGQTHVFGGKIGLPGSDGGTADDRNLSLVVFGAASGTQVLSGHNAYAGTTTVTGGTLRVDGSHTGAGAYLIDGGTLAGRGSIATAGGAGISFLAGSHLAPDAGFSVDLGTGTLDLTDGLAGASHAVRITLGTPADTGRLSVTNAATVFGIGQGLLDLDDFAFTVSPDAAPGVYTLFVAASPITGTLGTHTTGTFGGAFGTLALSPDGKTLQLTVLSVPEPLLSAPATLGLLLLRRRRRRG